MRCPSSLQRLPLVLISFLPVTGREETKVWATCLRQHRGQVTSLTLKPELQAREGEDPSGTGSLPALWTLDDPSHTAWGLPSGEGAFKGFRPGESGRAVQSAALSTQLCDRQPVSSLTESQAPCLEGETHCNNHY